ncbi:hypothetical protein BDN72DRAFT_845670 [Pluteus cervinus]|uniref:Uncharacterized protein n=1 Tax=Pluteus cervinus TaxID=181527 RepID=A0ACD3AIF5_9AGAR|nr:hypothetical protein BDN72DRAFT_845670 [Pluteus cervinus]
MTTPASFNGLQNDGTDANGQPSLKALTQRQERRLIAYLDEQFLELTRGFKKRAEPTTHLPTLSHYLVAAQQILVMILQVPPVEPSRSLRTAYLLRLTNDVLNSIPGYPADHRIMPRVVDWLDDLDQAWVAVLRSQVWDMEDGVGVDVEPEGKNEEEMISVDTYDEINGKAKKYPVSQTDITRLKSLLLAGVARLEEWVGGIGKGETGANDVETMMARMGVRDGLEDLFSSTWDELGEFAGYVLEQADEAVMEDSICEAD